MRKVCIVTAARSEYGVLRWTIDAVHNSRNLELQLVVTGAHLMDEQGYTYRFIEEDGYPISGMVDMNLYGDSKEDIVDSMGRCCQGFAKTFHRLKPDLLVVLGDRYELLPICSAALVMNIPIAHISGGDITMGAIDNDIRNAITMMSSLHFPGVVDSARNVQRMRNSNDNVWAVGEPGLENFRRLNLMNRQQLSDSLGIPVETRWILVTLHPETQQSLEYNLQMAHHIVSLLNNQQDISVVISKANADFGGAQINHYWEEIVKSYPERFHLFSSLGQIRYLSFMNECYAIIGNSSSGIIEAPCLGIPVINIGNRQEGRHICANVHQVMNELDDIVSSWDHIVTHQERVVDNFYGDGYTSDKIVQRIEAYLCADEIGLNAQD